MKNSNKILLGILIFIVVCVVGYALFSENITVTGTATAKGSFDITATCRLITKADGYDYYTIGGTGVCDTSTGVIKTISTLNKPTDMVYYEVTLKNTGTIPAKLKKVTSSNNYGTDGQDINDIYIDMDTGLIAQYTFFENECADDKTCQESELILGPNETTKIAIWHSWYEFPEQPVIPESGAVMNYDVVLDFEQVVAN